MNDMILPEGLTSIGEGAMRNCVSLTSLIIPPGVSVIDPLAFEQCSNLTLTVTHGSYAEQFAGKAGMPYFLSGIDNVTNSQQ